MKERKPKDKRKDGEDTTEFETFQELLEEVLSVPKEELDERRAVSTSRSANGRNGRNGQAKSRLLSRA